MVLQVPGYSIHAAPKVTVHVAPDNSPASLADFRNGFSSVIDPALPVVVNISSTKVVKQQIPDAFQDPLFRQFFGGQLSPQQEHPKTEREHSLSPGVIVNPDGYILTDNHVIFGSFRYRGLHAVAEQIPCKVDRS